MWQNVHFTPEEEDELDAALVEAGLFSIEDLAAARAVEPETEPAVEASADENEHLAPDEH